MPVYQISPSRWSNRPPRGPVQAQSDLPCPNVISDAMPSCEQVDGSWHESKSGFRAVGKRLGLVEVGNDPGRFKSKVPARSTRAERRRDLQIAIEQYKQGRRVKV